MSKPAGELTLAIRGLLDETDGAMTHSEARKLLKKMNFKIVRDPGRQSPEFAQFDAYDVDYDDAESINNTASACGFDEATMKAVLKEHKARKAFKSEANNFNVTKNIWSKNRASGKVTSSRKPTTSKNTRAKTAAAPARPRGKAPVVLQTGAEMEALAFVESNGGLSAVEKSLAEARSTVSELEQVIETVATLTKRLSAAA